MLESNPLKSKSLYRTPKNQSRVPPPTVEMSRAGSIKADYEEKASKCSLCVLCLLWYVFMRFCVFIVMVIFECFCLRKKRLLSNALGCVRACTHVRAPSAQGSSPGRAHTAAPETPQKIWRHLYAQIPCADPSPVQNGWRSTDLN